MFFFKQKTAYDMRISDWSSDVCSSDLPRLLICSKLCWHWCHRMRPGPKPQEFLLSGCHLALQQSDLSCSSRARLMRLKAQQFLNLPPKIVARLDGRRTADRAEIGRASCRERVCQYV